LLHRGVGALNAAADAGRPGVRELLLIFERLIAPALPDHPIDQSARFELLPKSLAVIGFVGEVALIVALNQRLS
jgi:hypothetical protein